jgi:hypothetical protein
MVCAEQNEVRADRDMWWLIECLTEGAECLQVERTTLYLQEGRMKALKLSRKNKRFEKIGFIGLNYEGHFCSTASIAIVVPCCATN